MYPNRVLDHQQAAWFDSRVGEVHVEIAVTNPRTGARADQIMALVDTGATLSVFPRPFLERLGINRTGFVIGLLADGREVVREVGDAVVTVNAESTPCRVLFGEAEEVVILGLTVLEQLGLAVDPAGHRLVPGRFLL